MTTFANDPRQRPLDPRQQKSSSTLKSLILYDIIILLFLDSSAPVPVQPPRQNVSSAPSSTSTQMSRVGNVMSPNIGAAGASDQEKAALIMQVLQLSDEQIAMLPPEQRTSILVLKEQIAKSTQR